MKSSNKAIVVGAGIAGLGVAYFLNKAGQDVTVIDKDDGTDNCSYGNAGMIVPSHIIPLASPGVISKGLKWMLNPESPFYIHPKLDKSLFQWGWNFKKASTKKHVDESAPLLRDLLLTNREIVCQLEEEESLKFDFHKTGLFMFCNTEKGLEEEAEAAEKAKSVGMPAQILNAEEVRDMDPGIDLDIIGATYYPKDSHLYPGALMDGLKKLLKDRGVRFEFQTEFKEILLNSGKVTGILSNDIRTFEASNVVICTGAQSQQIAKRFGLHLLLQAGKGYSITLPKPKKQPKNCGIFSEVKVTMTPMNGMLRFAGTMEITGPDQSVNPKKLAGLKKSVCQYLPDYQLDDFNNQKVWVGLRPCSPDGLPYVGRYNQIEGLYISTGQAMMGMSLGLVSGQIVADLITRGKSHLVHPLIDPNRYDT
ncbi:MAG TPA: FAD-dependent oxidoreductase [Balneolales bacterium]|nr:FAD-dependent oxidoreductase [Balneolales bacterium]